MTDLNQPALQYGSDSNGGFMTSKAARRSVRVRKNWVDEVEQGKPFDLTESDADESAKPAPLKASQRKGLSQRTRRLQEYGAMMTVAEVAEFLKVTADYIYELVGAGLLRKTPIGKRKFRIAVTDLEEYLRCLNQQSR